MRIKFIEIQNFRRLKSIRIDLSKDKTLFVGANNSGKTTAMVALRRFLLEPKRFDAYDFILSSWTKINKIGQDWEKLDITPSDLADWEETLPAMDVWLEVEPNEIHYVQHLLPTLDWNGGLLGVRLRLEPKALEELRKEYVSARQHARKTLTAAKKNKEGADYKVILWPASMRDFLDREFSSKFGIRSYILDPAKLVAPNEGMAQPQTLAPDAEYLEKDPFFNLIRIDEINAQRGFSDAENARDVSHDGAQKSVTPSGKYKLSDQLRSYYSKHLNPSEMPESSDVDALEAIHHAQTLFDEKLKTWFFEPLKEIQNLGYPGISDPALTLSTKIKPMDGLNHPSALLYEVSHGEDPHETPLRLPEQYNGLGYQNLISMVFWLMSFRDEWMQVGKIEKKIVSKADETFFPPPLHLVLVEEPEAHLHVQVQQAFIRKAYEILRNHQDLKDNKNLTTQLVVSTHSSDIAHECEFECLRYFRRKSASNAGEIPTSLVINLSEIFGDPDDTAKFVDRYLRAAHCDLFFADAAIFIEGTAERIFIPHFIKRPHFHKLNQRYLTLLEVGGSHAHRFLPLIKKLGLTSLIISDIDAVERENNRASQPIKRGAAQITCNPTLKSWLPEINAIDELLDLPGSCKIKQYDENFSVRIAYQFPVKVVLDDAIGETEIAANTFEDALLYENLNIFKDLNGNGLIKKFRDSVNKHKIAADLSQAIFKDLKSGTKAEFALELLYLKEPKVFKVPAYIYEGLEWLKGEVCRKEKELLVQNQQISDSLLSSQEEVL